MKFTTEDIKRLNYIKYTTYATQSSVRRPHPLWLCLIVFFCRLFYYIFRWRVGSVYFNEILVVGHTVNNQKSVNPILEHLPKDKCIIWNKYTRDVPYVQSYIISIIFLPVFFKLYFMSSKNERIIIKQHYMDFITTCGMYREFERLLIKNKQLKLIIFSNDHTLINRCLIELAELYGVKTLYVQHASVSEAFPPLRFDYAFLDGMESFMKYKSIGNMRGQVFLSGSPRFDAFHHYLNEKKIYDIGIALNIMDNTHKVLEMCKYLKIHYSKRIIVRPHTGIFNSHFDKTPFINERIDISNPNTELSYQFLGKIKVLVANESGIHLDAALLHVPSLLYNFSDNKLLDWYSFIKNGLINYYSELENVVQALDNNFILPTDVVRYYVASFNLPIEGRVGEMIAGFIMYVIRDDYNGAYNYIEKFMKKENEIYQYV